MQECYNKTQKGVFLSPPQKISFLFTSMVVVICQPNPLQKYKTVPQCKWQKNGMPLQF